MSEGSLLSRLAAYSQNPQKHSVENFTTEVLAYLVNTDRPFRREFVRHLVPDGRLARRFRRATAKTQQRFKRGVVDLVLENRLGRKLLVEVKILSRETLTLMDDGDSVTQVKKYLGYRQGPVAYLTTRACPAPATNSDQFLGQFYFEDLYTRISSLRSISLVRDLFVRFMEEQGMTPPKPLTSKDVRRALGSFEFAAKCEATLAVIRNQVAPEFRRIFRTRAQFTSAHFSPEYRSAYSYAKSFTRGPIRRVGLALDPEPHRLLFSVYVRFNRDAPVERLRRKLRWEADGPTIYSGFYVRGDGRDSSRMVSRAISELRKLRRVIV